MSNRTEEQTGYETEALVIYFLPVLLLGAAFAVAAWVAALQGASYRLVKGLTLPATIVLSNVLGALLLLPTLFAAALISGNRDLFELATIADLSLMAAWGPFLEWVWQGAVRGDYAPRTQPLYIAVYQLLLWFGFGRAFTRAFAMGVFDGVVARHARLRGLEPMDHRLHIAKSDAGYASEVAWYESKGRAPLFGLLTVTLGGASPFAFYGDHP